MTRADIHTARLPKQLRGYTSAVACTSGDCVQPAIHGGGDHKILCFSYLFTPTARPKSRLVSGQAAPASRATIRPQPLQNLEPCVPHQNCSGMGPSTHAKGLVTGMGHHCGSQLVDWRARGAAAVAVRGRQRNVALRGGSAVHLPGPRTACLPRCAVVPPLCRHRGHCHSSHAAHAAPGTWWCRMCHAHLWAHHRVASRISVPSPTHAIAHVGPFLQCTW